VPEGDERRKRQSEQASARWGRGVERLFAVEKGEIVEKMYCIEKVVMVELVVRRRRPDPEEVIAARNQRKQAARLAPSRPDPE
jgi:hypothetical protein